MKPIETVDKCTTCSTCVAYCPVTKATRAFKGPKLTGPSSERFRLYDETGGGEISEIEALDYCSNCKNCDIACPSGVKISTLNMLARAEYCKRHKPPLRDWVLSHGRMLGRLARRFPGWLVNVGSTNALTRLILDKFGVDARAPMPVFVPRSFTEWMGDHNAMLTASDRSRLTKKAVFFPGCYVNDYDPQTGKDLVFMLEKAGYEVIVPEFECCGLPMVANGFFDDARAAASRNVDTLAALVSSGDVPVLTVCPSCQLMLKQEYAEYFPELGKHESIVPHVQDACEFLIGLIESGELDIDVREDATKLVYHAPCHLRAQGIGKPGLDLLRMASANVEDARSGCCGISGSYGFKKEKYDVAASVGSDLFKAVRTVLPSIASPSAAPAAFRFASHEAPVHASDLMVEEAGEIEENWRGEGEPFFRKVPLPLQTSPFPLPRLSAGGEDARREFRWIVD
ncbi:MAG: anaerobic glycerol-3-phosphate dehydrogenase subunit C [Bilophila wadsworthia]